MAKCLDLPRDNSASEIRFASRFARSRDKPFVSLVNGLWKTCTRAYREFTASRLRNPCVLTVLDRWIERYMDIRVRYVPLVNPVDRGVNDWITTVERVENYWTSGVREI